MGLRPNRLHMFFLAAGLLEQLFFFGGGMEIPSRIILISVLSDGFRCVREGHSGASLCPFWDGENVALLNVK